MPNKIAALVQVALGLLILIFRERLVAANSLIYTAGHPKRVAPERTFRVTWLVIGAIVLLNGLGELAAVLRR